MSCVLSAVVPAKVEGDDYYIRIGDAILAACSDNQGWVLAKGFRAGPASRAIMDESCMEWGGKERREQGNNNQHERAATTDMLHPVGISVHWFFFLVQLHQFQP